MKSPRERNILVVVLAVAGLGLTIDRVVFSEGVTGPAESSAGVLDLEPDAASLLIQPTSTGKPVGEPGPSLADRLRLATLDYAVVNDDIRRDAFSVPAPWREMDQATGPTAEASASEALEKFQSQNRLDAVLVTGDKRCAVVNGQTLYIGQALLGYRLIAVHERSAEFESGGKRVLLGIHVGESPS